MTQSKIVTILFAVIVFLMGIIGGLLINQNKTPDKNASVGQQFSPKVVKVDFPREWTSPVKGMFAYALLFEKAVGGKFILEECEGYHYVNNKGIPERPNRRFCKILILGKIKKLAENRIELINKMNNSTHEFEFQALGEESLSFEIIGKKLSFKQGRKNDLLQYFENLPEIVEAKKRLDSYIQEIADKRRRQK